MASEAMEALRILTEEEQEQELHILKLSEPFFASTEASQPLDGKRSSDISSSTYTSEHPTPASLEADLTHYTELFKKLKISYGAQVTKEKFLRAIVGDPPIYVSAAENASLEHQLRSVKATLKAQKLDVAEMLAALERQSRELGQRHQHVTQQTEQLRRMPGELTTLKEAIEAMRVAQAPNRENPALSWTLPRTVEVVAEREEESARLDEQLAVMREEEERMRREVERLQEELMPLQEQRQRAVAEAKEARRRKAKGDGGVGDDLEARGRWLRAAQSSLVGMLEI